MISFRHTVRAPVCATSNGTPLAGQGILCYGTIKFITVFKKPYSSSQCTFSQLSPRRSSYLPISV